MSLLHPTTGEVADRWCVVVLKQTALEKLGKRKVGSGDKVEDVQNALQDEGAELSTVLRRRQVWINEELSSLLVELFSANRNIWIALDAFKATRSWQVWKRASLTWKVASLNDRRSELVRALNRADGVKEVGDVKVYG